MGEAEARRAEKLQECEQHFKGKLNIYTCNVCRGHVVTRDIDAGVTPFAINCRATPDCRGFMHSSMYKVFDQTMKESFQWRRPASLDGLPAGSRDHVQRGGLLLYQATFDGTPGKLVDG